MNLPCDLKHRKTGCGTFLPFNSTGRNVSIYLEQTFGVRLSGIAQRMQRDR